MNRVVFSLIACLIFSSASTADSLAPSLLELREYSADRISMSQKLSLKKASTTNASATNLSPSLSGGCESILIDEYDINQIRRSEWELNCRTNTLIGTTISVDGLSVTGSSVLLKIHLHDGQFYQRILSAENSRFTIPSTQGRIEVFSDYVLMGVQHLLIGLDHILFVACLVLLVARRRTLVWVVTMFTLGHSITLSLSTLGLINVPTALAEVFIAFSVLYAASELLDKKNASLIKQYPAVMAAAFGLLHGLGFASVLSDVGVPQLHIPLALFAFNIGIEIGQLIVIFGLLGLSLLLRTALKAVNTKGIKIQLPIYLVGCLSSLWFWERILG